MKTLDYSPENLGYVACPSEKEIERKQRVDLITDINTIQCSLGKSPISVKQFNEFMDSPLEYLMTIVRDQSSLLRIHI